MDEQSEKTLDDIKRLLILDMVTRGIKGADIAKVLNVNRSTITRIVPTRSVTKS